MPTGSKLVAALFFGALAWFAAGLVTGLLPPEEPAGWFAEVMALVGAFSGWTVVGARSGDGYPSALGYGLTTSVVLVFWGLLIFSGLEMLEQAFRKSYGGPVQAILSMVNIAVGYARMISVPDVLGSLFIGGLVGGYLAEYFGRRWS